MASTNSNDPAPNPGDDAPRIRFISELFSVPERAFAYLAIRYLGWPPAKFLADCRDLTLKELEKLFETRLVRHGYPCGLVRHLFLRLRKILRTPPPRDRPSGDDRPLGAYKLREFLTIREEEDVVNWCRAAEAILEAAREKARIGDARFELFWAENHDEFARTLRYFVRSPRTTPEDIAHLTWLAIFIGYDTGAAWDFPALRRIALEIYERETCRHGLELEFLDELAVEDVREEGAPRRRIPDYVKVALLETLFSPSCLPHEIIAFLCRWVLKLPPQSVVENYASRSLFDMTSEIFAAYLPRTSVPEPVVREWFARFDSRLGSTLQRVTRNARRLESCRSLLKTIVGWTRLKNYFKRRDARGRADEVGHWGNNVLRHLKNQATTPGTPLFLAILRWRNEDPDFGNYPEQDSDDSP